MKAPEAAAFRKLIATPDLPGLGPDPRAGIRTTAGLLHDLEGFFADQNVATDRREALKSAALLWHDHLEDSHRISQNLSDANGSLLHAIMHRREPDYANAKYWLRRAGVHPAYPEIARQVRDLIARRQPEMPHATAWGERLLPGGRWSADAFVDACEEMAERTREDREYQLLQEIQAIELDALLLQL